MGAAAGSGVLFDKIDLNARVAADVQLIGNVGVAAVKNYLAAVQGPNDTAAKPLTAIRQDGIKAWSNQKVEPWIVLSPKNNRAAGSRGETPARRLPEGWRRLGHVICGRQDASVAILPASRSAARS